MKRVQPPQFILYPTYSELDRHSGIWVVSMGRESRPEESWLEGNEVTFPTLVYVHEGQGEFIIDGQALAVRAGDLLIYNPGQTIAQYPVLGTPWDLYWIVLEGPLVRSLFDAIGWTASPPVHHIGTTTLLPAYFHEILECAMMQPFGKQMLVGRALFLLGYLGNLCNRLPDTDVHPNHGIANIVAYMVRHLAEPLTLDSIAAHFDLSISQLTRRFRRWSDQSVMDSLHHLRVERSLVFLWAPEMPIPEIAERVGYTSLSSFYRNFKRIQGCTPGEYRAQHQRADWEFYFTRLSTYSPSPESSALLKDFHRKISQDGQIGAR